MSGSSGPRGALRAVLERTVLDEAFREHLRRDPEAALAGYALDREDSEALAAADDRVLSLLGRVLREEYAAAPRRSATTLGPLALDARLEAPAPALALTELARQAREAAPGARYERIVALVRAVARERWAR